MERPRNLDDLLRLLPGLRRLRTLDAGLLRLLLDRRKGDCTWCGDPVGKGRQTWCGDECVRAFKLRCCQETVRRHVEKRDRGICQLCGRDTLQAEREAGRVTFRYTGDRERDKVARAAQLEWLKQFGYARGQFREVDHDPPVSEYGGLCPADELRLLCGVCHADQTARLARRSSGKVTEVS